jgi:hypothetical protein
MSWFESQSRLFMKLVSNCRGPYHAACKLSVPPTSTAMILHIVASMRASYCDVSPRLVDQLAVDALDLMITHVPLHLRRVGWCVARPRGRDETADESSECIELLLRHLRDRHSSDHEIRP